MVRIGTAAWLLVFVLGHSPDEAKGQEGAPVYKDGESWTYRIKSEGESPFEFQVAYKNGKFESNDPDTLASALWVTVHLNDPERKWLDFPLDKGKKWSFRFYHTSRVTGRGRWRNSEAEVVGPAAQPVETAVGKFKAIEVRRADSSGRVQFNLVYFYSPETKSTVKVLVDVDSPRGRRHHEMELIKYSAK